MQVDFRLTSAEVTEARRVFYCRLQSRTQRVLNRFFIGVGVAMVTWAAFIFFLNRGHRGTLPDLSLMGTLLIVVGLSLRRRLSEFSSEPDYSQKQTMEFEEEGILRSTWPHTKVRLPWTKISRYVETDDMFLLLSPWPWGMEHNPTRPMRIWRMKPVIYIVPKRAFASNDVERFRDLLQRRLSIWAENPGLRPNR